MNTDKPSSGSAAVQAPSLPLHYVPRPEVDQALKALLLAQDAAAHRVLAVHGLPGVGKTTTAASLCHDVEVQAHFADGILWLTLGQEPELLVRLHDWIRALGDYDARPATVADASAHLRTLLADRACLLVVDDAWQADQVRPCLVGGPRCRVLLTTRDTALARELDASLYALDVMTASQALALFEKRLGPLAAERAQASDLARALGYLPLALELAAAQIAGGVPWNELRAAFQKGLADLTALDLGEAQHRNESLRLSFRLSLDPLPPGDRQAFAWLGVLPEDVRIQPAMVTTLWAQPESDARARLQLLGDRALLRRVTADTYTLHDLLHDEARLRLAGQMPLSQAHVELLARYQAQTQDGLWHTLPADRYIHEHLIWHLEQAGWADSAHALLREETATGQNGWHLAREALGQTAGYLADVGRAWRQAEAASDIGLQCRYALLTASINSQAGNIPPELLVALVEKGIWPRSQGLTYARQVPDLGQRARLVVQLVQDLPRPQQVQAMVEMLAAVGKSGDEGDQCTALEVLVPFLATLPDEDLLAEALALASAIDHDGARAGALEALIPHFPAPDRSPLLAEALALVPEIRSWKSRGRILATLAPRLAGSPLLAEALAVARDIDDAYYRASALIGMAPHLHEPQRREVLAETLALAWETGQPSECGALLADLAPILADEADPQMLLEALSAARGIRDERYRGRALARMAAYLPEPQRSQVLPEALTAALNAPRAESPEQMLAQLAPHLGDSMRSPLLNRALDRALAELDPSDPLEGYGGHGFPQVKAVTVFRGITDDRPSGTKLAVLAPYLPEPLLAKALDRVAQVGNEGYRALALEDLAPHLPQGLQSRAVLTAWDIGDAGCHAWALAVLALHLAEPLKSQVLVEVLAAMQAVVQGTAWEPGPVPLEPGPSRRGLAGVLAALRSSFPERRGGEAQHVRFTWNLPGMLADLAPHLAGSEQPGLIDQALALARQVKEARDRVWALRGLIPYLAEPLRSQVVAQALAAAGELGTHPRWARTWAALIPHVAASPEPRLIGMALGLVREIRDQAEWASLLLWLVPRLPDSAQPQALSEALAAADGSVHETRLVQILARIAPQLPEQLREQALAKALELARGIEDARLQSGMLALLIPLLPEPERAQACGQALAAARKTDKDSRAWPLIKLAPHLDEPLRTDLLKEALDAMSDLKTETWLSKALIELAPHLVSSLDPSLQEDLLAKALAIKYGHTRAEAVVGIAPHLPEELLARAWAAMRGLGKDWYWREAVVGLAPYLPPPLLLEALAVAQEIEQVHERVQALGALVPVLPEPLCAQVLDQALAVTRGIEAEGPRAFALAALAPYLDEALLAEGVAAARAWRKGGRTRTLCALAPYLSEPLLAEALAAARGASETWAMASALAGLAPYLPGSLLPEALAVTRGLWDESERAEALEALVARLAALPPAHLPAHWRAALRASAAETRQPLLQDLPLLAPLIAELGGSDAFAETFCAIQDVGRWWP